MFNSTVLGYHVFKRNLCYPVDFDLGSHFALSSFGLTEVCMAYICL